MKYDAAIIGGGLAGLSLSIDLARRGHSVVVIEKGSYPRQKVCGEYISTESQRYLQEICPALRTLSLPQINTFKLSSIGNRDFKTDLLPGGFGISRYLLEELLHHEALACGVVFLLDTKATQVTTLENGDYAVDTRSGSYTAKLVCNASGRRSNLETAERGQKQVSTNYVGIKYHVRLERDPKQIEIHNFPGGYCGISNVEENKSCLCYLVNADRLQAAGRSIPVMERTILSQNKNLAQIFNHAEFITKEPVTISGINFLIKEPLNENTFFLGDSAGSIAPVTGNGMSMALRSACVFAQMADAYFAGSLTKEQLRKKYTVFWNQEFSARIKWSRYFQKLSESPALTRLTIGLFRTFPPVAKGVIALTHGKPF